MSSKILDDMRDVMRRRHYSIRTERSYCEWVKRFVLHFNMKSRDDLSETKGDGVEFRRFFFHFLGNLWDVPQFISLYRQKVNIDFVLRFFPPRLKNKLTAG
jgi:hypothetical protein